MYDDDQKHEWYFTLEINWGHTCDLLGLRKYVSPGSTLSWLLLKAREVVDNFWEELLWGPLPVVANGGRREFEPERNLEL